MNPVVSTTSPFLARGGLRRPLPRPWCRRLCCWLGVVASLLGLSAATQARLMCGIALVDISPTNVPVRVNAMFTERTGSNLVDRLHVRALVLEGEGQTVAIAVVDTCMLPRDLIDAAKHAATATTGIPAKHMMISATHTHSAPSAMGCLGSRVDPGYAAFLPGRIAAAIEHAFRARIPAEAGAATVNDWDHTFNRRWIRRPDRQVVDPFGNPTGRAHMHPGYQSPDAIGPSGPVDPGLSVVAFRTPDGRPLAVLANYSQHYYGSPLLSSDYYGRFAAHLSRRLGFPAESATSPPPFLAMLSQGTSGDLMWMDYASPKVEVGYDAYADEIAARVERLLQSIRYTANVPIRMAERRLTLRYRTPDPGRLAWARAIANGLAGRLPSSLPEIYALEAIQLHERQQTELVLQALRIGRAGITALPNEVFALTGLKLKAASPLSPTFNTGLANGAEGYIPPPEQHVLGGYTTWPARTAGLETEAEPRIVETLTQLLEEVSGQQRRPFREPEGIYARTIRRDRPVAFWRLNAMSPGEMKDAAAAGRFPPRLEPGVAVFLPGPGSGDGKLPSPALRESPFQGPDGINRAVHLAGGRLVSPPLPLGDRFSIEFWFWNGLLPEARPVAAYLLGPAHPGSPGAPSYRLGVAGSNAGSRGGGLFLETPFGQVDTGSTRLGLRRWHHLVLVVTPESIRVHLDGNPTPELSVSSLVTPFRVDHGLFLGGDGSGMFGLEGRLDEVAFYGHALPVARIVRHSQAGGAGNPE